MRGLYTIAMLLLGFASGLDYASYEGLRLDMSALTLNRDIIGTVIPGLNRTLKATFPDVSEEGSFFTKMRIHNMRITYYKVDEQRFLIDEYEYKAPIYKLKGGFEAIYFHISFHFEETWIGIPICSGTGSGAVTNVNNLILVFFNESDPDVQIPHPWDIKNLTLSSLFKPTTWVLSLLHKSFIPHFHKAVDDSMYDFAHNLLRTYRYIEDVFPHDIDLIFRNDWISVKPTVNGDYFTISFKTNITVNGYVHRKMYRTMNGTVAPRGDFDYCLASQLVPDVMDALGKGNYYDSDVPASLWGLDTNTVHEFFGILPGLRNTYTGMEEVLIHCQISRSLTVNDVTTRGEEQPPLELQLPEHCTFTVMTSGDTFLTTEIIMRFYYECKCKDRDFYGHVSYSRLYEFKELPSLPGQRRALFEIMAHTYAGFFSESELISPGIRVSPNREKELVFEWAYMGLEEICFHYGEVRPSTSKLHN